MLDTAFSPLEKCVCTKALQSSPSDQCSGVSAVNNFNGMLAGRSGEGTEKKRRKTKGRDLLKEVTIYFFAVMNKYTYSS